MSAFWDFVKEAVKLFFSVFGHFPTEDIIRNEAGCSDENAGKWGCRSRVVVSGDLAVLLELPIPTRWNPHRSSCKDLGHTKVSCSPRLMR